MDLDIDSCIYRIINGFYYIDINNETYKIYVPSRHILHKAHLKYLSILDDLKFDNKYYLTQSSIDNLLLVNNLWTEQSNLELASLNKLLDGAKIKLYLEYSIPTLRRKNKDIISEINDKINKLINNKNYFNALSIEYYSNTIKNEYIIINTVYKNDKLVFDDDIDNIDVRLLENIIYEIQKNSLTIEDLKKIICSYQWKSYWDAGKEKIFNTPVSEWTEEQRLIITLSKNYDAMKEHPEAPSPEIMMDSDALEGWILYQNDKANKEKKLSSVSTNTKSSKSSKSGYNIEEIFLPVSSQEEVNEVIALNDPITERARKSMIKKASVGNSVKWTEFPGVVEAASKK